MGEKTKQRKRHTDGYRLMNREVYYVSRMVSSQKERDFVRMNYDDIKKVFSIWLCMNMKENSVDYVHLVNEKLLGSHPWEGGLDLLNIVLVGIAKELPGQDRQEYELHRLLGTVLSAELTAHEKLKIIETEYNIAIDDQMREDVSEMCNLGQGVFEVGEARAEARIIERMYKNGFTPEQIAEITEKTVTEIGAIIEEEKAVFV